MKKIEIFDGYIEFPSDWIVVEYCPPIKSRYVGVAVLNKETPYNVPYFVFFSEQPINKLTLEEESIIISSCIAEYPRLRDVLSLYVPLMRDHKGKTVNGAEWFDSPKISCTEINELSQDITSLNGATIIRFPHGGSR